MALAGHSRAQTEGVEVPEPPGDALVTFRWGIGRYRIVLLGCLLLGVVLLPAYERSRPTHYDAESLVVADQLKVRLVALPRYGQAVFNNGEVARRIAESFGIADPQSVVPTRVSVTTPQDALIFHVFGHDEDPKVAASMSSLAAAVFTEQLNRSGPGVGSFAVQAESSVPVKEVSRLRAPPYQIAIGALAGLALGLALIGFLLVVRQPVVQVGEAEEVTGSPVLASVQRQRRWPWQPSRLLETAGLVPLCRRLVAQGAATVLVVGSPRRRRGTRMVLRALSGVVDRAGLSRPTFVDDVYQVDWDAVPEAASTLIVVEQGSSTASVQAVAADNAAMSPIGIVFIRTSSRLRQLGRSGSRTGRRGSWLKSNSASRLPRPGASSRIEGRGSQRPSV